MELKLWANAASGTPVVVSVCKPTSAAARPGPGKAYLPQQQRIRTLPLLSDTIARRTSYISFVVIRDLTAALPGDVRQAHPTIMPVSRASGRYWSCTNFDKGDGALVLLGLSKSLLLELAACATAAASLPPCHLSDCL